VPNAYGHLPLENNDPTRPVEAYFRHVDFIVNEAEKLGLYVGMLPTWGDKWNKKWGVGPEIFTPENAAVYGEWLGRRYRDKPILWILGGDRIPENERHTAIIRAMAAGLKKGDGGAHLMTFHPMGGRDSAEFFHEDDWLSFNMFQSGHGARDIPNYQFTTRDYHRRPVKPTLDGEANYEDHPINWKAQNGYFDDADVRRAMYWSLLAGACGHTYGDHNIWQFLEPGRKPISAARTPWRQAIDHPGAFQVGYARRLFESRPYQKLVPAAQVLAGDRGKGGATQLAARTEDGSFLFAYTPTGTPLKVTMGAITGPKVRAAWFDPRAGVSSPIGEFAKTDEHEFKPPSEGRGHDWVLVLDDAAKGYPALGKPLRAP
jgi:Protein of unknown function (DUF4038)/Putative collagen-binding domain of a collagenase